MKVRKHVAAAGALVACASSLVAAQTVAGQLPGTPDLPAVPSLPALQPPDSVPEVPQVETPKVPLPVPQPQVQVPSTPAPTPGGGLPDTPVAPGPGAQGRGPAASAPASSARGAGQDAPGTSTGTAAKRDTRSGASTRTRASRSRRDRDVAPARRAERNLRSDVARLWPCSYAITGVQRQVLARRFGLEGHAPTSPAATGRALGLSRRAVARAQRVGVRGLRRTNRAEGCAMTAVPPALAGVTRAMVAVATAPPLAPVAAVAGSGRTADRRPVSTADEGGTLGERASSSPAVGDREAATVNAQLSAPLGDDITPFLAGGVLLAAFAALAAALTLRGGHQPEAPVPGPVAPPSPGGGPSGRSPRRRGTPSAYARAEAEPPARPRRRLSTPKSGRLSKPKSSRNPRRTPSAWRAWQRPVWPRSPSGSWSGPAAGVRPAASPPPSARLRPRPPSSRSAPPP